MGSLTGARTETRLIRARCPRSIETCRGATPKVRAISRERRSLALPSRAGAEMSARNHASPRYSRVSLRAPGLTLMVSSSTSSCQWKADAAEVFSQKRKTDIPYGCYEHDLGQLQTDDDDHR